MYKRQTSPVNVISNSGCEIIKAMYSSKVDKDYENKQKDNKITLNDLRFLQFERSSIKSSFKLGKLPPTEGAAEQHCLRVYRQVQAWQGNNLNPCEYGWMEGDTGLLPRFTRDSLVPKEVLEKISCGCKTGCGKACGCRKHGLKCTRLCSGCNGEDCDNAEKVVEEGIEEEDDENEIYDKHEEEIEEEEDENEEEIDNVP